MIGPQIKKMPNRKICTGCDVLVSKEMGGTKVFRKFWVVNYCSHKNLSPYTRLTNGRLNLINRSPGSVVQISFISL